MAAELQPIILLLFYVLGARLWILTREVIGQETRPSTGKPSIYSGLWRHCGEPFTGAAAAALVVSGHSIEVIFGYICIRYALDAKAQIGLSQVHIFPLKFQQKINLRI